MVKLEGVYNYIERWEHCTPTLFVIPKQTNPLHHAFVFVLHCHSNSYIFENQICYCQNNETQMILQLPNTSFHQPLCSCPLYKFQFG